MPTDEFLAKSLEVIFKPRNSNQSLRVLDYSNSNTFLWLWQIGMAAKEYPGITHLILCGTEPPPEAFAFLRTPGMPPTNIQDHFTAYSWAAAFRLINPRSPLTILIIATSRESQGTGVAADLSTVFMNGGVCGVCPLLKPMLDDLIGALTSGPVAPLSVREKGTLRGVIGEHLLPNPEDHHKLGNIVGALMLSPDLINGWELLGSLLRALEPETKFDFTDSPEPDPGVRERIQADQIPVVLFDDMAPLWKPFVQRWAPGTRLNAPSVDDPSRSKLVKKIKELAQKPVHERALNASDFGVSTERVPDGAPFVLLLDLRLFAGDHTEEEAVFVDELASAAAIIKSATNLKWPLIPVEEIDDGRDCWEKAFGGNQVFSPVYRKVRSWLPRLISLVDPTLPIVIFSSTADPVVLRAFQGYGNIITDFSKPVFRGAMGEAKDWAQATCLGFDKALRAALKIIDARKLILSACPPSGLRLDDSGKEQSDATAARAKRVEIFIDESGTASQNRFALGAVVLVSGPNEFDHSAYRSEAKNTVGLWGLDDVVVVRRLADLEPRKVWLKKGKNEETGGGGRPTHNERLGVKLSQIDTIVRDQKARLFACSLLSVESPTPGDITSLRHPFHRYRDLLARLLEAILFHIPPVVSAIAGGADICIDAATAKNDSSNWNIKDLHENFGADYIEEVEHDRSVTWCRTMAGSHVLPLVAGLLFRYKRETDLSTRKEKERMKKLIRARAAQLTDFAGCTQGTLNRQNRADPKPLHYLADWIAHFTWDEGDWREVITLPVVQEWFSQGFCQVDGEEFQAQLLSHRRWAQGQRIDAIRGWKNAANEEEFTLTPRLAKEAQAWMCEITGDDLRTMFHAQSL